MVYNDFDREWSPTSISHIGLPSPTHELYLDTSLPMRDGKKKGLHVDKRESQNEKNTLVDM